MSGAEHITLASLGRRTAISKDGKSLPLRANCEHADSDFELRRHVIANGTTHYKFECQVCGRRGNAISQNDPIRTGLIEEPPYTSPDLRERYWLDMDESRLRAVQELQESRRAEYNQYLESPEWQAKRDLVLKRDWYQCQAQLDGCTKAAEHVHHLTYTHLFNEPLFELVAVCRSCHDQIHGRVMTIMGVAV